MIDKTQGLFWYNGAVHYILPHCFALLLIALLLQLFFTNKTVSLFKPVLCCLLSFFLGGSNYITGLCVSILFIAGLFLILLLKKAGGTQSNSTTCSYHQEIRLLLLSFCFFLIAFLLNILAPGNAVRQATMENRPGVLKSVLLSFYYCAEYLTGIWFDWTYLLFLLLLIPFLWEAVKAVETRFSFPCPLLLPIASYCFLSSMFTPSLFASGIPGGGRIFNIIFLDFLLLIIGNLFYFLGWIRCRLNLISTSHQSCLEQKNIHHYFLFVLLFSIFIGLLYMKVNPDYFTSSSALRSLISQEASSYRKETTERTHQLQSITDKEITLKQFSVHPYLLFFSDIETDAQDWKNSSMARYYQKEQITGIPPE